MNHVGMDLHKKTIVLRVMNQDRKVLHRKTFACCQAEAIREFFAGFGPFRAPDGPVFVDETPTSLLRIESHGRFRTS